MGKLCRDQLQLVAGFQRGLFSWGYILVARPGAGLQQIQEGRLLQRAVLLSIPLLRIEADQDALAQEEGGPHDHIPDWTLPPIMKDKIKNHPKAHEEAEENRVEETEADGQDVLVHYG